MWHIDNLGLSIKEVLLPFLTCDMTHPPPWTKLVIDFAGGRMFQASRWPKILLCTGTKWIRHIASMLRTIVCPGKVICNCAHCTIRAPFVSVELPAFGVFCSPSQLGPLLVPNLPQIMFLLEIPHVKIVYSHCITVLVSHGPLRPNI